MKNLKSKTRILVCILAIGSMLLSINGCNKDSPDPPPVPVEDVRLYKKSENPLGLTVRQWIKDWEVYNLSRTCVEITTLDANTIPGQNQLMVFLNGTKFTQGTANITIQEGQSIFVPIASTHYSTPTCPNYHYQIQSGQSPESFLSETVTTITNGIEIDFVKLDGIEVENVNNYRYKTEVFNLTLNQELHNCPIYCYPEGELQTMEEGYFIVIKPLSPGVHLLDLSAKSVLFELEFYSRFNITVE